MKNSYKKKFKWKYAFIIKKKKSEKFNKSL